MEKMKAIVFHGVNESGIYSGLRISVGADLRVSALTAHAIANRSSLSLRNLMEAIPFTQSPFAALTFVAAPAILTNASSVLAMSTINRMLRTRDRMTELLNKCVAGVESETDAARLVHTVNHVETQAALLLKALHSIYVSLGAFASATLVTLLGAGAATYLGELWLHVMAWLGVALGLVGVGGLVLGCAALFHATQLSLTHIREEASFVRECFAPSKNGEATDD